MIKKTDENIAVKLTEEAESQDPSPLEVILQLLERRQSTTKPLDFSTVNLVQVTDDFLAHIQRHQIHTLAIGDYLEALSKLLLLKLNHLLKIVEPEPEITINLERFQQVRRARTKLRKLWLLGPRVLGSARLPTSLGTPLPSIAAATLVGRLAELFQEAVVEEREVVLKKKISLERARQALELIVSREREVVLQERFPERDFLVVVFLASLLLYREQVIEMEQIDMFGKITVRTNRPPNSTERGGRNNRTNAK